MRIALVHSYYGSGTPSGENVVVDQQRAALEQRGHEVHVVAAHTDELARRHAHAVRTALAVATGGGYDPTPALTELDPDVVHVHNLFPNIATSWLDDWAGPLVTTLHNFRPACANGLLLRDGHSCTLCPDSGAWHGVQHGCYRGSRLATAPIAFRNRRGPAADRLLDRADAIACPGEHVRDIYASWGIPPEKLHVIPHFTHPQSAVEGTPPREWVVASRLSPEKGVLELLEVWPDDQPLVVYGAGPLQEEVERRCQGPVRYGGHVSPGRVSAAIATAPALIIPSTWLEIGPLTYGESLAQGTPVIALRGNAAALDVERSGSGLVFDDFPEIPATLRLLLADRDRYAAAARDRHHTRYTLEAWYDATLAMYRASGA